MEIPAEIPIMTLPNTILFPQALLPLHIFEPRYRKMLADALTSHRMFAVAMQRPDCTREAPSAIAGLGLVRIAIGNDDGTSHLILQGLTRVRLSRAVRYKPYRVQKISPLQAKPDDSVVIDALVAKVRELVQESLEMGIQYPFPLPSPLQGGPDKTPSPATIQEIVKYLEQVKDPDQLADLVSCALLPGASERQTLLETVDLFNRLKKLIFFLMAEIRERRKA